jgi:hypothetical protein
METFLSLQRHYHEFPVCEWQNSDLFDEEIPIFKEFPEYLYAQQLLHQQMGLKRYSPICITKKIKKKHIEYVYYFNHSSPYRIKSRPSSLFQEDYIVEHGEYGGKILKYEFSDDDTDNNDHGLLTNAKKTSEAEASQR